MNKFFAVVLSVLFVVAAAAPLMATESRQIALGGVGNYIEDDYNIFAWPATLTSYSNTVWMGVSQMYVPVAIRLSPYEGPGYLYYDYALDVPTFLGASYGLGSEGKYGTLGMFLYHNAAGLNPFGPYDQNLPYYEYYGEWELQDPIGFENTAPWSGAGVFSQPLPNKLALMYGYATEAFSIGFSLNRSDASSVYGKDETKVAASYTVLGGGLRFDIGEKAYMDVAADFGMASYTDESDATYKTISDDNKTMLALRGRLFYEWNETITWVPRFSYKTFNFSLKADTLQEAFLADNYGDKGMMFDIGLGANIKVNEDNLLVFALEPYSYMKYEPSKTPKDTPPTYLKKTVMPRFFLALESDVKDWLTFRVGAMKELAKLEGKNAEVWDVDDVSTVDGKLTTGDFGYFMGLGFHVADFDIDCVVNNQLPLQLGYWLTGYNSDLGGSEDFPVYMLSAKYHF